MDLAKRLVPEAGIKFLKVNMTISTILFIAITELTLCLMPSPAVLLILSQGILHGARKSVFGIISIIIEFQVLAGYACLAEQSKQFLNKGIFQVIINKLGGIFLIGAGIRLSLMENET
jgi:threonine/homoserine/homoserine lactone efflux protein